MDLIREIMKEASRIGVNKLIGNDTDSIILRNKLDEYRKETGSDLPDDQLYEYICKEYYKIIRDNA